jgi:nucleotide-binding universal stress UspA family protein
MTTPAAGLRDDRPTGAGILDHVIVALDAEPESLVAAVQARVLTAPGGRLELLAVAETYLAAQAGAAASVADDDLYRGTQLVLERARELVEPDDARLCSGRLVDALCGACARAEATLVAVGVRPHGRLGTLVFGGHDIEVLHRARCSSLIARPGWGPASPERIVVGIDGSPEAQAAERAARELAGRLACDLVPVVGRAGEVGLDVLKAEPDSVLHPGGLVEALGSACRLGDLVVVGHAGGRANVAERVAYAVPCSVLVVRHGDA